MADAHPAKAVMQQDGVVQGAPTGSSRVYHPAGSMEGLENGHLQAHRGVDLPLTHTRARERLWSDNETSIHTALPGVPLITRLRLLSPHHGNRSRSDHAWLSTAV